MLQPPVALGCSDDRAGCIARDERTVESRCAPKLQGATGPGTHRMTQRSHWRRILEPANADRLAVLSLGGVVLDFLTTTGIFLVDGFEEGNEFLTALAEIHLALPVAFNLGYGLVLAGAYVFVGGWIGRVGGVLAVASLFLGVNNLLYFAFGDPTVLARLFGNAIHEAIAYGIPAFGFVAGSTWHLASGEDVPWRQVGAVVALAVVALAVAASWT